MKLTHAVLALLWVFTVTVEAQGWVDPSRRDGGSPWDNPEIRQYERPRGFDRYPQETTNIYQHPDDGAPSQAPYITVPVQPNTGDTIRGGYRSRY